MCERPLNFCFWMLTISAYFIQLGNTGGSGIATFKSTSQTSTHAPFMEHPLAGLLVLGRFDEFRAHLEEALQAFVATGQDPSSKLHYEVFVYASFYPISKIYKCVTVEGEADERVCEHILIPTPEGMAVRAFFIKYVLAPNKDQVQSSADDAG